MIIEASQAPIKQDETLLRIFRRVVGDGDQADILLPEDFERRNGIESGISLWRLSQITLEEAIGKLKTKKWKGAAVCEASVLLAHGLILHASGAHVSAHCPMCDLKSSPDCATISKSACPLFGGTELLTAWCAETFTVLEIARAWPARIVNR